MLYIVVATLNALQHVQRLLAQLTQTMLDIPFRIVLVDQQSTDGTIEWLMALKGQLANGSEVPMVPQGIMIIANQTNIGAAAAWNMGIRFALANGATRILVCGHDTLPMPGTIERLVALTDAGALFVTGTAVPYDTPEQPVAAAAPTDPVRPTPDFSFFLLTPACIEIVGKWDAGVEMQRQHEARERNEPSPAAFMSPWDWGLFDARYRPAYFEDNDYHVRMQYAGVRAVCDPGALFRHDCSLTIRSNPALAQSNETTFRRNGELFRGKWGALPPELPIQQARPLNVTDEQWAALSGGRPVEDIDRQVLTADATALYARYALVPTAQAA
jgi:glycosyltransferase involved in cell wall biosynthesis